MHDLQVQYGPEFEQHVLCYVDPPFAWFTGLRLDQQWGDDWDDRPYEHNAGQPYEDQPGQLLVCAYTGPLVPPCDGLTNSRWSVQDINARACPWLARPRWMTVGCPDIQILAGQTFREFRELIWQSGGQVMCPIVRAK